jgi:hypothetical protein
VLDETARKTPAHWGTEKPDKHLSKLNGYATAKQKQI